MKCKICEHEDAHSKYLVREMMFGLPESFEYFKCSQCECLQIAAVPTDMSKYYPANYYSFADELVSVKKKTRKLATYLKEARDDYAIFGRGLLGKMVYTLWPNEKLKKYVRYYWPNNEIIKDLDRNSRILDVGCGKGEFLFWLKESGFTNLLGADPFLSETKQYDNGLKIIKGSLQDIKGSFDLIMFQHSLEHIPNQEETMKRVSELLAPGGMCLIRIPIVSSQAWEIYRENWVSLDAPRHFFLHSIKSMNILAAQNHLSVQSIVYDSTDFQFWGSEQYKQNIPLMAPNSYLTDKTKSIFTNEQIASYKIKAQELNAAKLGDSAGFLLRKD